MIAIQKSVLSHFRQRGGAIRTIARELRPVSVSSFIRQYYRGIRPRTRPRRTRPSSLKAPPGGKRSAAAAFKTSAVGGDNMDDDTTAVDDDDGNVDDLLPTRTVAKTMPTSYREMDNTTLTTLGAMGNHAALEEMLKRHIMNTDRVTYQEASQTFLTIEKKNHEWETSMALPFQLGIAACFVAGTLSVPLVFHLPTVEYFNEHFVTAEHPPTKELETALEVGAWSWNWMEPVMGTSTFLLLSMQYMRMHLQHLGVTPYTHHMKRYRGKRLADAFPQYNQSLLFAYSESSPMYNPKDLWI